MKSDRLPPLLVLFNSFLPPPPPGLCNAPDKPLTASATGSLDAGSILIPEGGCMTCAGLIADAGGCDPGAGFPLEISLATSTRTEFDALNPTPLI